mmetsp:Transcript_34871/g.66582  ORF Transcript_34871/g.66582 Transcript_34871/m.66582 type:complete len:310 (+) Transcript_34871:594-1523(+)
MHGAWLEGTMTSPQPPLCELIYQLLVPPPTVLGKISSNRPSRQPPGESAHTHLYPALHARHSARQVRGRAPSPSPRRRLPPPPHRRRPRPRPPRGDARVPGRAPLGVWPLPRPRSYPTRAAGSSNPPGWTQSTRSLLKWGWTASSPRRLPCTTPARLRLTWPGSPPESVRSRQLRRSTGRAERGQGVKVTASGTIPRTCASKRRLRRRRPCSRMAPPRGMRRATGARVRRSAPRTAWRRRAQGPAPRPLRDAWERQRLPPARFASTTAPRTAAKTSGAWRWRWAALMHAALPPRQAKPASTLPGVIMQL